MVNVGKLVTGMRLNKFHHLFIVLLTAICLSVPYEVIRAADTAASTSAKKFTRGLLWRIERGDTEPSYLFGTIHTGDPRVTTLPPPVQETFDQASSFTMELITGGEGVITLAEAMYFNDSQTLSNLLGAERYADTREKLIKRGLSVTDLDRKKPWAVIITLSMPKPELSLPLDLRLQWQAVRQGKPVYGLESVKEQIAIFNDIPLEDQIRILDDSLTISGQTDEYIEALIQAYVARDLASLMRLVNNFRPKQDAEAYNAFMERLLKRRNFIMADRMLPRLQEGNAFIAVGAGHLAGEQGLLRLLELKGYRLTSIY